MNLTPGVTINAGDQVSRQTIYDLLAHAGGGQVTSSDLSIDCLSVVTQSEPPTPYPGKLWFDQTDQLLKLYVDVLDGTGVSLWLAIGPDRFDIPMLAGQPIPFGAAVQVAGNGRYTKLPPGPLELQAMSWQKGMWESWKVIGFNNDGIAANANTAASGTWFACAIDGICWIWHPVNKFVSGVSWLASKGQANNWDGLISGISSISSPSGISDVAGGLVWSGFTAQQAKITGVGVALSMEAYSVVAQAKFWSRGIFYGARGGRL